MTNVIPARAAHPKIDSKCDKLPLYISTILSIYDKILKVYNIDSISNLLGKYRKITRSINGDIYMYITHVKITPHLW